MISILRKGPKLIVLGSSVIEKLGDFLMDNLDGTIMDLDSALENGEEDNTIVFLTDPGKRVAALGDIREVILIPTASDSLFSSLINLKGISLVQDSHISPGTLLMRTMGDFDRVIESIKECHGGMIMPLQECLDKGTSNQTILSFTEKPIAGKISLKDLKPSHLLIDMDTHRLFRRMRIQTLRFLNEGLVDVEWYDVQIRIYDRYSKYKLHYDRLSLILDSLEPGLILGESWTKDYPRFLMSVLVFQVRFFTLLDPVEIKKLLLGLEYLDNGTRIVDLDLMHKNKKIDWPQAIDKKSAAGRTREQLAQFHRNQILNRLNNDETKKLHELENQILMTRD